MNENCLCMVCVFVGVMLIDNVVFVVLGFFIGNMYVMVGVFEVFCVMVVWLIL